MERKHTHLALRGRQAYAITACDRDAGDVLVLTRHVALCDCVRCLVDVTDHAPEAMAQRACARLIELAQGETSPLAKVSR